MRGVAKSHVEIQDILSDSKRKGKLVHDSQAAVNYLTYDTNQWISYDDKTTFQQKVDWANNIGYVSSPSL